MKIQDVIQYLETLAPLDYAESFDNVGLLVGNAQEPFRLLSPWTLWKKWLRKPSKGTVTLL